MVALVHLIITRPEDWRLGPGFLLCGRNEPIERLHDDILAAADPDGFELARLDQIINLGAPERRVLLDKTRNRFNLFRRLFHRSSSYVENKTV